VKDLSQAGVTRRQWGHTAASRYARLSLKVSKIFARKQLRSDLYCRLIAFRVMLPSLRERQIRDREPSRLRRPDDRDFRNAT
jgi:hypothetical protein